MADVLYAADRFKIAESDLYSFGAAGRKIPVIETFSITYSVAVSIDDHQRHEDHVQPRGLEVRSGHWFGNPESIDLIHGVGQDFDSGLALVKPSLPLQGPSMALGRADALNIGDTVSVMSSGGRAQVIEARVVAKQEFAGRWEYVLDHAVFTSPPHESWSGAALVDSHGRLCGLGSLVIQGFEMRGATATVNMFVPIELLAPIIDEVVAHGRRLSPPRPWLGMLVHDDQHDLTVVGVYRNCPADKAGLRPGDVIVGIDDAPVNGLANMFRRMWSLGSAGVDVPLDVLRNSERMQLKVRSGDRAGFQRKGTLQ